MTDIDETQGNETNMYDSNSSESNLEDENFDFVKAPSTSTTMQKPSTSISKQNKSKSKKSKPEQSKTSKKHNLQTSQSNTMDKKMEKELKTIMKECFGYEVRNVDLYFLKELYSQLPKLYEIWDRIGFNKNTKETRVDNFYNTLTEAIIEIVENEEILESKIEENIESNHKKIKEICFKLQIKYDELSVIKSCSSLTMLEEDEELRKELKRLEKEVKKRMDEYEALLSKEAVLCKKLVLKPSELVGSIPSEMDIKNLEKRIDSLDKTYEQRKKEMNKLQEEISTMNVDLEMSSGDSFVEIILFESVDEISLGEKDLKRAVELRDDLKRKHSDLMEKIKSLRVKIKELWTKLNIENVELRKLVNGNEDVKSSKKSIYLELEQEYERCFQIKMENMQKFIEAIRDEIKNLCAKMYMGDKDIRKLNLELLNSTEYTEQLLTQHEEKLEDLKFRYTECEGLYEKTAKWMQLWSEFVQFEEKTKDPLRFKQRGYNMLEEEKQRKCFNNQLPKLEDELSKLAEEYKQINGGQEFTIHGQVFSDFIHTTKLDYEESKQKEKYEKQVLKDNIKKNESRYGSKPVTPLALKKRKAVASNFESQMNTPEKKSKLQKTHMTNASSVMATPGTSMASSHLSTVKAKVPAKSKLAISKRKSKTPGKNRLLRRSRAMANESKMQNATKMSQKSDDADATLRTTTLSSTIYSTVSSNSSNLHSGTNSKLTQSKNSSSSKCPPLSSSSKFAASLGVQRMTSTASNTFIEEDNENNDRNKNTLNEAAAKIGELANKGKMLNVDLNYLEFSRDLPKPIKFGHDSTNSSSSQSRPISRSGSTHSKLSSKK